jgi:hypothetical protein
MMFLLVAPLVRARSVRLVVRDRAIVPHHEVARTAVGFTPGTI